jgi:excisionase family DNA binding protein
MNKDIIYYWGENVAKGDNNYSVFTVQEASKMLRLSRGATYEAIRHGQIPSIRVGRRILIPYMALMKLLEGNNEPNCPCD